MKHIIENLMRRYPVLTPAADQLEQACRLLIHCFEKGGKLLLCGNGGSSCDCEHIAGELMKSFKLPRKLSDDEKDLLARAGDDGRLAEKLQSPLPCIVLSGLSGLTTAFNNDVDASLVYAQQAWAYAHEGDVLIGISTSGSSDNVVQAAIAAKARGAKIIGLTGEKLGRLAPLCDVLLNVPGTETYCIQELHLPVYHAICLILEEHFFAMEDNNA